MPAPIKRYYSSSEIMEILGCGRNYANNLMHMFAQRGQLLRDGKLMRVKIADFEQWVNEHTKSGEEVKASYGYAATRRSAR